MFDLGVAFPPDSPRVPTGFEIPEFAIWKLFVDGYGDSYKEFYYQVRVGEDRIGAADRSDAFARMTEAIALKRIDVVGVRGSTWDLIEVRRHAGPGSIGQILTYETLWLAYSGPLKPYTLTIVTDYMDVDTQLSARSRGMSVFVV